jgi:hypothetical protein
MITWAATDIGTVPAGYVDDGGILPSPYNVSPGTSLGGFSFQSPNPPTSIRFYAQGFTPIPETSDAGDLEDAGLFVSDFTSNSIIGVTQGPTPSNSGLQPSGLGFLDFKGLGNNAVVKSPFVVGIHFDTSVGMVYPSTFHISLNGQDITNQFTSSGSGYDLVATIAAPLHTDAGGNVLDAVVSGIPTGATSTVFDEGRVKFYVNSNRPLDLNGDGVIDCLDLAIVKASFGLKSGQPNFDPRADVNGDGVVNVLDLSAVAKQLAAGTSCP